MMMAREQTASTSSKMCVEKIIALRLAHPANQTADFVFLVWVQPVGRFVQNQDVGIMNDGLGKAGAMAKTFGKCVNTLMKNRFEKAHFHDAIDRFLSSLPRNPLSSAQKPRKPSTVMSA